MSPVRRLRPAAAAARADNAIRRTREDARGFVSVKAHDKQGTYHDEERELNIASTVFDESNPPVYVKVGAGLTINLGNFESLRIDCAITYPVDRKRIDEAYEYVAQTVADYITQEQTEWLGQGNAKKRGP